MPWYEGPTLLEYLETVPLAVGEVNGPVRFPVQLVLRPDANFRGFAGQVARGVLAGRSERVMALPSRRETYCAAGSLHMTAILRRRRIRRV